MTVPLLQTLYYHELCLLLLPPPSGTKTVIAINHVCAPRPRTYGTVLKVLAAMSHVSFLSFANYPSIKIQIPDGCL
jgi:hypothetical protein